MGIGRMRMAVGGLGAALGFGLATAAPAAATLLPGASMQVSPTSVPAGGAVTVSGSGCAGNYEIQVRVGQGAPVATNGDASDDTWSVRVPIPAATAPGTYAVTAACDSYNEVDFYPERSVTVVAATTRTAGGGTTTTTAPATGATPTTARVASASTAAAGAGTGGAIPETGVPAGPSVAVATATLAIGGALLVLAQHLRTGHAAATPTPAALPMLPLAASPAPARPVPAPPIIRLRRRSAPPPA